MRIVGKKDIIISRMERGLPRTFVNLVSHRIPKVRKAFADA